MRVITVAIMGCKTNVSLVDWCERIDITRSASDENEEQGDRRGNDEKEDAFGNEVRYYYY